MNNAVNSTKEKYKYCQICGTYTIDKKFEFCTNDLHDIYVKKFNKRREVKKCRKK